MRGLMKLLWERFRLYLAYAEFPLWNPLYFCTIFKITCALIAQNGGFVPVNIHECDIQVGQHPVIAWLSSNSFRSLKKKPNMIPFTSSDRSQCSNCLKFFAVNTHCCSKAPLKRDLKLQILLAWYCQSGALFPFLYFSPSLPPFSAYD